jgi:myo-inositol 2-dehydrogenase / D-chiro-inositol 1-dehydrogenase
VSTAGVALVGLGAIGADAHLPALLRSDAVRLVAVADSDERRLASASVPPAVVRLHSLDAVLDDPKITGVVLATPPWASPDLAIAAARAGRFVLVEKPVATDPAAAGGYGVLSAAERSRIQVGLTYRHDPAMVRLRSLIEDGVLGAPLLVRAHIYDEARTADPTHTELIERTLEHGSPVIHEGAHVLDWLAYLLGTPPEIEDAWSLRTRAGLPDDNLIGARLRFGSAIVLAEFGWFTEGLPRTELTVTGDGGTAVLDGASFGLELTTVHGTESIDFEGERVPRCFDLQVARFAALIDGAPAEPSLDDGIAALEWSAEIDRRAKGRR